MSSFGLFCQKNDIDQSWEAGPDGVPNELANMKKRAKDIYPQGREQCEEFLNHCQKAGYRFKIHAKKTKPNWTWFFEVVDPVPHALGAAGFGAFCEFHEAEKSWEAGPDGVQNEINNMNKRDKDIYPQGREQCLAFLQECAKVGYRFKIKAQCTKPHWTWFFEVINCEPVAPKNNNEEEAKRLMALAKEAEEKGKEEEKDVKKYEDKIKEAEDKIKEAGADAAEKHAADCAAKAQQASAEAARLRGEVSSCPMKIKEAKDLADQTQAEVEKLKEALKAAEEKAKAAAAQFAEISSKCSAGEEAAKAAEAQAAALATEAAAAEAKVKEAKDKAEDYKKKIEEYKEHAKKNKDEAEKYFKQAKEYEAQAQALLK